MTAGHGLLPVPLCDRPLCAHTVRIGPSRTGAWKSGPVPSNGLRETPGDVGFPDSSPFGRAGVGHGLPLRSPRKGPAASVWTIRGTGDLGDLDCLARLDCGLWGRGSGDRGPWQ